MTDSSATERGAKVAESMAGERLPGEGDVKYFKEVRERIACHYCGEPADNRHAYLLPDARRNRASSAYGKDDISWCSDYVEYTCKLCRDEEFNGREPTVEGYRWCSTFYNMKSFPHMFLRWVKHEIPAPAVKPENGDGRIVADETRGSHETN